MASRRFSPAGGDAGNAPLLGYRVVVVASSVGPVVEAAGGFLCDRARAGWDVSVLFAGPCDPRPLAVLGVSAHRVSGSAADAASVISELPRATTVVVGADLLCGDAQARDALARFARHGCGAVRVWGRPAQADVGNGMESDPHELSRAVMAFKAHALRAAGNPGIAAPVEALYRVRGESYRLLHSV